jgi:hypothetical protein
MWVRIITRELMNAAHARFRRVIRENGLAPVVRFVGIVLYELAREEGQATIPKALACRAETVITASRNEEPI